MKQNYLENLRLHSCYPTFRIVVKVGTAIGFFVAVLVALSGLIAGHGMIILSAIAGAMIAVLVRVVYEMAFMLADIADAVIDSAAAGKTEAALQSRVVLEKIPRPANEQH